MCQSELAYEDDLATVNNVLIEFLDEQNFPDEMTPLKLDWSILHSYANLSEPQEAHTHLVPEYSYGCNSKVFHFSCIIRIKQHTFVDLRIPSLNLPFPVRVLIK